MIAFIKKSKSNIYIFCCIFFIYGSALAEHPIFTNDENTLFLSRSNGTAATDYTSEKNANFDKATPAVVKSAAGEINYLLAGGFEQKSGWKIVMEDGAEGTGGEDAGLFRNGKSSMCLRKKNGIGYIHLVSAEPVRVAKGKTYRFFGYFHSEDAPISSLLLFRVAGSSGSNILYDAFDGGAGLASQSLIVNKPPGEWHSRTIQYFARQDADVYLHVLLYGNPTTVWLDDLVFTDAPFKWQGKSNTFKYPYTKEEVLKILEKRENAFGSVTNVNGLSYLAINGKPVPPVILKDQPYRCFTNQLYDQFGKAGIQLMVRTVELSQNFRSGEDAGIRRGKNEYRWDWLETDLLMGYQQNPAANYILDLWLYSPYPGWGDEYPDECWKNEKGERAYSSGFNVEGFTDDLKKVKAPGKKYFWYPSYNSEQWRKDMSKSIRDVIAYIMKSPYGKGVVGFQITGGNDGQFQLVGYDYSSATMGKFHEWLRKKYGAANALNKSWQTTYEKIEDIGFPAGTPGMEKATPFLTTGLETDYRLFQWDVAWEVRDYYAGVIKESCPKPVFVNAYGQVVEYEFWSLKKLKHLDSATDLPIYAYRLCGYALGYILESSLHRYNKYCISEIDLRTWASGRYTNPVSFQTIGLAMTPKEFYAIQRKMAGVALAADYGWWYYTMNRYFDDPVVMADIAKVYAAAERYGKMPARPFRPDVCLVRTEYPNQFISAPHGTGRLTFSFPFQEMMLETSGVPFDVYYLDDLMKFPDLQNYKIYIFYHNVYLTAAERKWINEKLKNSSKTLVWMYDTGYISENGKSAKEMSELVGMNINTEEIYERGTPIILPDAHPLTKNILPFQGMDELLMAMVNFKGQCPYLARPQPFWIDDPSATVFARYRENQKAAMAVKKYKVWTSIFLGNHKTWTSIFLGAPFSLGNDLLNNIAVTAGAYTCGKAGQSIHMNGKFVSLHGLKSEKYMFRLPPGARRMIDADSGKVLADGVKEFPINVVAGETYWFFME